MAESMEEYARAGVEKNEAEDQLAAAMVELNALQEEYNKQSERLN